MRMSERDMARCFGQMDRATKESGDEESNMATVLCFSRMGSSKRETLTTMCLLGRENLNYNNRLVSLL